MWKKDKKLQLGDEPTEPTEEVAKKLCGSCKHRQTTKCLLNGGVMAPNDYCSQHTE